MEPITKTQDALGGQKTFTLDSKDGSKGVLILDGPGAHDKGRFLVKSAIAIQEFSQMANCDGDDFDGEANFTDWVLYVFTQRKDVEIML